MAVSDDEVERIASIVMMACAASGGASVYVNNGKHLSLTMGDRHLCWLDWEDGQTIQRITSKIRDALAEAGFK